MRRLLYPSSSSSFSSSALPSPWSALSRCRFRSRCGAFVNVTSWRGRLLTAFLRISFLFYFFFCPSLPARLPRHPRIKYRPCVCLCTELAACCLFLHHSLPVAAANDDDDDDDVGNVTHLRRSRRTRQMGETLLRFSTFDYF